MNKTDTALRLLLVPLALAATLTAAASTPFVGPGPISLTANPAGLPSKMEIVLAPSVGGKPSEILYYGPADDFQLKSQYGVATTYNIGRDYDGTNYTGSTLTWTTTNSERCRGGVWVYQAATYPSGWDNKASSAAAAGDGPDFRCNHFVHWENTNWGGSSIDCNTTCSTMGVMNNASSSNRIYR